MFGKSVFSLVVAVVLVLGVASAGADVGIHSPLEAGVADAHEHDHQVPVEPKMEDIPEHHHQDPEEAKMVDAQEPDRQDSEKATIEYAHENDHHDHGHDHSHQQDPEKVTIEDVHEHDHQESVEAKMEDTPEQHQQVPEEQAKMEDAHEHQDRVEAIMKDTREHHHEFPEAKVEDTPEHHHEDPVEAKVEESHEQDLQNQEKATVEDSPEHHHQEDPEEAKVEESQEQDQQDQEKVTIEDAHEHDHQDHSHHHHHHRHDFFKDLNDSSSIILVIKHLSSTLLSFLPEHLQDTILDVDDALVFTGIIALTLVSICVPYFLIEGYMSVRPLKKKVVELNKSLWKVSAAYETQQEEFEIFKQKAIAYDEFKKRAEQSENDVVILKKLETKQREQILALRTQLKSHMKEAGDIRSMIEKTLEDKKAVSEECEKYKSAYENTKEALLKAREELANVQTHAKSTALQLGVSNKNAEVLSSKITMLEQEMEEIKSQRDNESEKRKTVEKERQELEQSKVVVEKELGEIKKICHQYESTVGTLNEEISKLESELNTIRESLGEDSPLLEVAEIQAKAAYAEKEAESLRTRLEGLTADNENLHGKLKETTTALEEARSEREQTNNRLQVLETYFKEREEEYIKSIEQLQLKESVRDKGKEELIRIIEEKENVCKDLNERLDALKEEFEETKQQHRNEIRALEAKGHENWLSLCQAERKAQDARKEAELLRQRLTAMSKDKDEEDGDGLNGDVNIFANIPHELVPPPLADEPPSYFGLGDFIPPPPLPEGEEREPHRPPPLGGRLSPSFSDFDDNILSPIGVGRREDDCTDGSSGCDSPRRDSPPLRGGWVNVQPAQGRESMRRLSRATSSPIQPGANL